MEPYYQIFSATMIKTEKSIRRIVTYFLVLGFICAFLTPVYFSSSYGPIVGPICVILMCSPRLIYQKKWASVLLMINVVLTTLALLYFDAMLIILSQAFDQQDISGYIALVIITAIVLLNCCLCFKLYKLLFKAQ